MWVYSWYCYKHREICPGCIGMNASPEDILNVYHPDKTWCRKTGVIVLLWIPYHIWNADLMETERAKTRLAKWINANVRVKKYKIQ